MHGANRIHPGTSRAFSPRRNDKSARTPYILVSGLRGSKRNIGNVPAGYLTNCYKLRRAFSRVRPNLRLSTCFPRCSILPRLRGRSDFRRSSERYSGDHMVLPYVHAAAMVLTLIRCPSCGVQGDRMQHRCSEDGIECVKERKRK